MPSWNFSKVRLPCAGCIGAEIHCGAALCSASAAVPRPVALQAPHPGQTEETAQEVAAVPAGAAPSSTPYTFLAKVPLNPFWVDFRNEVWLPCLYFLAWLHMVFNSSGE